MTTGLCIHVADKVNTYTSNTTNIIIGTVIGVCVFILIIIIGIFIQRSRRHPNRIANMKIVYRREQPTIHIERLDIDEDRYV